MTDHHAPLVGPPRFSIGNVLAVAWQGIERHWLALFIACAAAGTAATVLPVAMITLLPQLASIWAHPLIRELIQVALAILVVMPALVLLLRSHGAQDVALRDLAAVSARRAVIVVVCQVAIDFIVVAPAYLFGLPFIAIVTVYLAYEIPLLAFNYIFFATLAAEPIGPFKAVQRTFQLLSGHWWRMFAITLILWAASWAAIMILQYSGFAFGLSGWRQVPIAILSFGVRLFMVIPIAAAAYHLLSRERDGLLPERAALVFD